MVRAGKFSQNFLISHDADSEFPNSYERAQFGYLPFDLFLTDETPEGVADPNISFWGSSPSRLQEKLNEDLLIIFRYKHQDFDIKSAVEIPDGAGELPAFQQEVFSATLSTGQDFDAMIDILEDTVEVATDADYCYRIDMRREATNEVIRCADLEVYKNEISSRPLKVIPEMYGVNEMKFNLDEMNVLMSLYEQTVRVYREEESELRRHGIEEDEPWEEVQLDYNEAEVDRLEQRLEAEGFNVEREYLPENFSPSDI